MTYFHTVDWIAANREWVFSGIGVVVLTALIGGGWRFVRWWKQRPDAPSVTLDLARTVGKVVGPFLAIISLASLTGDGGKWVGDGVTWLLNLGDVAKGTVSLLGIAILVASWLPRRRRSVPSVPQLSYGGHAWRLAEIVADDAKNIAHRLIGGESFAKRYFSRPEPYLEIHVPLLNATVFDITLQERVEGDMAWQGSPLRDRARVLNAGALISHAERVTVMLRQHVSPETATQIDAAKPDAWIETGHFRMTFTYQHLGTTKTFSLGIAARVHIR